MSKTGFASGPRLSGAHLANLHTFLIAARHLSFSRAAGELCLTPSAVSHRIARLEEELALKLFHRLPRKVRLTDDGERIFRIMQDTMDALSEALQERAHAQIAGQLTLYVSPSVAQCWLVPRLADFTARYPGVQLDIRVGNERIDYRTRNIDLVLCYSNGEFPGLASSQLMRERIAPVCSPEYARRLQLHGHPERLSQCTLLHDVAAWDNAAFDAEWRLWARATGATEYLPEFCLSFDRSDLCVTMALHHGGVAIGREQLVRQRIESGELVLPFGGFIETKGQGYFLVHPPHEPMPRRLQALIDWLRECAGTQ
ncbi:LysR family transcriptional regulator, D-serine deaminase activator [Pseudomonas linyingensis]|uniref:LysR family transcriptional regulator, D-serine deaminase activator n=1 Tax=Pseudomonas linyingensis TaxID=915471 RepID=A0A1H6ZS18_9PSED|nr:DNA-binding transcriptional regulator DsdC [Pseudomonas linyingensis]SEJ52390.1 LysR family transcriptional regulator, D-serine deaminase activator [Pseudomonas linyingensis]